MGVLEDEYRARLRAVDPTDQAAVSWVWLWYVKERYAADGLSEIYALCQKGPKDTGLKHIFRYMREEITLRELYDLTLEETVYAYASNLLAAGVLKTDVRPDAVYLALAKEVVLELMKACRPLLGFVWDPKKDPCPASHPACTVWLHFIDSFHEFARLPRVRELVDVMVPSGDVERELVASDVFTEFVLTDQERIDLETDLDLTAGGGGLDARSP